MDEDNPPGFFSLVLSILPFLLTAFTFRDSGVETWHDRIEYPNSLALFPSARPLSAAFDKSRKVSDGARRRTHISVNVPPVGGDGTKDTFPLQIFREMK